MADRVVSKELPGPGRQVVKKEESIIVKAANVRDAIADIYYII